MGTQSMTSERWDRIERLFAEGLVIDPTERQNWLLAACGDDEQLRAEVARLLEQDERAVRDRFLTAPAPPGQDPDQTGSWHSHSGHSPPRGPAQFDDSASDFDAGVNGFSPRPAIATGPQPHSISDTSVVRARLRELPVIHIVTLAMANYWRCTILGDRDSVLRCLDASAITLLGGLVALLWTRWRIPLAWLQALELGMIGILATRLAIVEYHLVLTLSLCHDPTMAQFTMKNVVLLTAILIPSYGLYVPKNWRRAAVVVGPLALLPFATLLVLYLRHPDAMAWLGRGLRGSDSPRYLMFSFDAMVLLILAVASTFGARVIALLRRQIAEAKHLGQYRLRRQIGAGGMGEVYLAEHQLLKRPCALKLLRPESVADPRSLARFEREVRLTAALSHPNTVEIYDYGRTDKGTYYYVMEYLPGLSLADLVERHGPQSAGRVVYLLRQICQALREAHAAGLIHRDIKPSNIFVSRRGGMDDVAKLLDFGLVLPVARFGAPQLSREGQILGTPLFMSPEQAAGSVELDGRSDIYSLGAVAYFLLTGRPPFEGEDGLRLLIAHARDPVVPPSLLDVNIPRDLERVVLRCLSKRPADRFPDSESLENALGDCACVDDWDQRRAARWWETVDRASGRVRGSHNPISAGS
jgi:tRNA A-37 threonylcarbamoyl transferase component Bud32